MYFRDEKLVCYLQTFWHKCKGYSLSLIHSSDSYRTAYSKEVMIGASTLFMIYYRFSSLKNISLIKSNQS